MARRNDHTREELVRLVVDAAGALVDECGPEGVTARAIAARVGYTAGTLYTHFANLDDVFLHVNLQSLKRLRLAWGAAVTPGANPAGALHAMGAAYLAFVRAEPRRFQLMIRAGLPAGHSMPAYVRQNVDQLRTLLATQLRRLDGASGRALELRADALFAGMHGVCVLALEGQLLTTDWQASDDTMALLIDLFVA